MWATSETERTALSSFEPGPSTPQEIRPFLGASFRMRVGGNRARPTLTRYPDAHSGKKNKLEQATTAKARPKATKIQLDEFTPAHIKMGGFLLVVVREAG